MRSSVDLQAMQEAIASFRLNSDEMKEEKHDHRRIRSTSDLVRQSIEESILALHSKQKSESNSNKLLNHVRSRSCGFPVDFSKDIRASEDASMQGSDVRRWKSADAEESKANISTQSVSIPEDRPGILGLIYFLRKTATNVSEVEEMMIFSPPSLVFCLFLFVCLFLSCYYFYIIANHAFIYSLPPSSN